MAASSYLIAFLVVVALCLSPIDCNTQDLIATVCQSTEDKGFCTRVFNQNLVSPDTNMHGLAKIALDQAVSNATASSSYVKQLFEQTTEPELRNYYLTCGSMGYAVALGDIEEGQSAFEKSQFGDMVTSLLSAAKSQAQSCDGPMSFGGKPNPIYERNREMRILISMSVATAFELKGGTPTGNN